MRRIDVREDRKITRGLAARALVPALINRLPTERYLSFARELPCASGDSVSLANWGAVPPSFPNEMTRNEISAN